MVGFGFMFYLHFTMHIWFQDTITKNIISSGNMLNCNSTNNQI